MWIFTYFLISIYMYEYPWVFTKVKFNIEQHILTINLNKNTMHKIHKSQTKCKTNSFK